MKRGFTLIELLAVIVILAIIALIAIPIVLDIIEDSKKSSSIRSAEYYLDAVEQAVAASQLDNKVIISGTYTVMSDGNICLVTQTDNTCQEEDTLEVQLDGERPSSGSITITSEGKVTVSDLNIGNKIYATNNKGNIKEADPICTLVSGKSLVIGSQYSCQVGDEVTELFYILENGSNPVTDSTLSTDQVAFIMNKNLGYVVDWYGAEAQLETYTSDWKIDASLPTYNQINNARSNSSDSSWLIPETWGYWTSTNPEEGMTSGAYGVSSTGGMDIISSSNAAQYGVRAVIIISKKRIG